MAECVEFVDALDLPTRLMTIFRDQPGLLARFRAGERDAMEKVYWTYATKIAGKLRRGFRLKGERHVPGIAPGHLEDLVQEIFAKAFTERARLAFDGLRDYGPFLFTIARNVLVDFARRTGREISLDDMQADFEAPNSSEEETWADPITSALVERYLRELSPELAAVHRERYVLGHPQRVAAEALGLSRQQLRTREEQLRAGLDKLLRHPSQGSGRIVNPDLSPRRTKL